MSATNLEIGVTCLIRGKVETEGDFTVQSRLLADYVALLPKDRVDLEVVSDNKNEPGDVLSIACKNHSTKIKGQLATDFPLIPQLEKKNLYIVDCQKLKQAISQVILAVSVSFVFTGRRDGPCGRHVGASSHALGWCWKAVMARKH